MEQITKTANVVPVRNRNNGTTSYRLSSGENRIFMPGQTRNIDIKELQDLAMEPGGEFLLKNYLIVKDTDALTALNLQTEPEYFYTEAEIKTLLTSGTMDQLEDCLNFAPTGVIELLKSMSVQMELPDVRKRKMIFEKTGFNVDNAINVNTIMNSESEKSDEKSANPVRKAEPIVAAPKRKTTPVTTAKYTRFDK